MTVANKPTCCMHRSVRLHAEHYRVNSAQKVHAQLAVSWLTGHQTPPSRSGINRSTVHLSDLPKCLHALYSLAPLNLH
jgi:hypothetical protein